MSNTQTADTAPKSAPPSEPSEVIVTTATVSCDGGDAMGHPKVYLTFNNAPHLTCPYCSQVFRLAPGAKLGHGH